MSTQAAHHRAEEHPDAEAGNDDRGQKRFSIGDEENESEVDGHHHGREGDGHPPAGSVKGLQVSRMVHSCRE
jgi:hypothetical protein